jgi:hypothetical protein
MPSRFHKCAVILLGTTLLSEAPAFAKRPIEDVVLNSPHPHESAGGAKVRVHYVSRHTLDPQGPGVTLKALQQSVQKCVAAVTKSGKKVNPPTAWPEEAVIESRIDSYYARNRSITYTHSVHFGVNPIDCSLSDSEYWTAVLESSYGTCDIDLVHKTYQGKCDSKAHEQAAVKVMAPTPPPGQQEADLAKMKANPQMAAMAASLQTVFGGAPRYTGGVKTFDGVKCDVVATTTPHKGTQCFMRSGSFVPSAQAVASGASNILLEMNVPNVGMQVADRVKPNTDVGASVFTPYLSGFTKQEGDDE